MSFLFVLLDACLAKQEGASMFKAKRWKEIPSTSFVENHGCGKQVCILDTRFVRVFWQRFLSDTRVDYHNHPHEWEIVFRFGWGICLGIYPPQTNHCLFGPLVPKGKWWTILSIKIGKKP
jgi:hypothetical protein